MVSEELPAAVRETVYVVIAAYNEGAGLAEVIRAVRAQYPHVVVVDDGSADDTYEVARAGEAYALRHLINRGQGAALQTGIEFALARGAEFVVTFDADGQHRVEDIVYLVEPLRRGECDVTLGSRFLGEALNLPFTRWLTLKLGILFTRFFSRVKLTDTHNGLRGFSRVAAGRMHITLDRMAHANEIIDLIQIHKLRFREIPVQIRYTEQSLAKGQSSLGALRIALQYLANRMAP